ncbi:MAG TPA: aldehyde dehydrogenase EutE [candidate division Zixibacteria bacterium]|nr:aldehyde dehydrogenase EutE [candidate division Zixibacteria bacterium]HBZ00337.1 aldehyde dehydrogenase EutE [candidate division Zixibacteria bacterium]
MENTPENIDRLVNEIMREMGYDKPDTPEPVIKLSGYSCLYETIDEATETARKAQKQLLELGLEGRKVVIEAMRSAALRYSEGLGQMAVKETGLGRMPDKKLKIDLAARKTPGPEDITTEAWSGDHGLTITEAAPYGVVGAITPSTNPAATAVNNAISIISAGNAILINAHPSAKGVTNRVAEILNDAIISAGGPASLITAIKDPSKDSATHLMQNRDIDLLLVTGGGEVVQMAMTSGAKAICAGPGNPAVVVDETADIKKAADNIIYGASFDNNILCTSEKETFAVDKIYNLLKREMSQAGGYELKGDELRKVISLVVIDDPSKKGLRFPKVCRDFVGKDAVSIAHAAGVRVPQGTRLLFFEAEWDDPMVMAEQLMPVHPLVRCRDIEEAIELAITAEHKFEHTFTMHSTNIANLSKMAQLCNGNIFVKNGPSMAGLGMNAEGFCTFSIAGTTGEGMTRARTFTRPRRCTLVDYFRIV